MEYITILLMLIMPAVLGRKTGPPIDEYPTLCTDMIPKGHNNGVTKAMDTADPPYSITTSSDKYTAGGSLTVKINVTGNVHFEGFFIQARRTDPNKNVSEAIGHFAFPPPKTKFLTCHSNTNSSWAHSDDNDWRKVVAVWKAPAQDEGAIEFKATIIGEPDKDHFYLGVKSSYVTFMTGDAVTVAPPPRRDPDHTGDPDHKESGDGKPGKGTGCTHGLSLVLSAAALIMAITLARPQ